MNPGTGNKNAENDWNRLPDQAGTYILTRIWAALSKDAHVNKEPVYGIALREAIIPYKKACYAIQKEATPEARQMHLEAWQGLADTAENTLYLVPFSYGDDAPGTEDKAFHLTPYSAEQLTKDSILYRCREMSMEQMDQLAWVCGEGGALTPDPGWWDISRFRGSEGYCFADENGNHGPMNFFTMGDGKQTFLGLETDAAKVRNMFPDGRCPHIAVVFLRDVKLFLRRNRHVGGCIMTPNSPTHCFLPRQAFIAE